MDHLLDREAWMHHHGLVWGRHEWPDDALLTVSWRQPNHRPGAKRTSFLLSEHVPVYDADAAWEVIRKKATRYSTYVGVAPRRAEILDSENPRATRGGAGMCLGLPALFIDLDTTDGVHKRTEDRLPTRAQAHELLAMLPVDVGLLIDSGGGYHGYVLLDEPLDHTTPEGQELLERWKAACISAARELDVDIDEGVLADVVRVLRPAGSINHKATEAPPVAPVAESAGSAA